MVIHAWSKNWHRLGKIAQLYLPLCGFTWYPLHEFQSLNCQRDFEWRHALSIQIRGRLVGGWWWWVRLSAFASILHFAHLPPDSTRPRALLVIGAQKEWTLSNQQREGTYIQILYLFQFLKNSLWNILSVGKVWCEICHSPDQFPGTQFDPVSPLRKYVRSSEEPLGWIDTDFTVEKILGLYW